MTSKETILVIGATGMLGEPVARRLAEDGYNVRVMSRNMERASEMFGKEFDIVQADVEDRGAVQAAMKGCDGVYISLQGGADWDLERRGAQVVSNVAKEVGCVKRITLISGASTCKENAWFEGTKAKLAAEKALLESGVPYTIFRCTMFMELLPKLVMGKKALVMGRQVHSWHWIASQDYAEMVSKSFQLSGAANKTLHIRGPEALTFEEALGIYIPICAPDAKVTTMPFWLLHIISWLTASSELRNVGIPIMKYFTKIIEIGDPAEANELLGAPSMTVRKWSKARKV